MIASVPALEVSVDRAGRTESIAVELRADIIAGVIPAGDRLIEAHLCERYRCGRAAARAALLQLESEQLVDRQPNRGATVRRVTVAEAVEIIEARAALEGLIAARAARHATTHDHARLRAIIADMAEAVAADDARTYSELNQALHADLCEVSRHVVAVELVRSLRNRAVSQHYLLAMMPGRARISFEQHAVIVDAVVSGDESAAAVSMKEHLASVVDALRRWSDE